jgi:outer membrane immunogenic protein
MKRIFLATAAFAVLSAPAYAGDLLAPPPPAYAGQIAAPAPAPVPPPVVKAGAPVDWTGAYVGGLVQYSTGNMTGNDASFTLLQQSLKPDVDGFMGGVLTGFNYQYNSWVFGVVGDIAGGGVKGSRSDAQPMGLAQANAFFGTSQFTGPANVAARLEVENNWIATARGRIGFSWYDSPFLIYGTGGVAFGDVKMRVTANGTDGNGVSVPFSASESRTLVGYAVGAGTEWMLDRNFSLGAEYLYVDLQKQSYLSDRISGGGIDAGFVTHNFRLNLNYHF